MSRDKRILNHNDHIDDKLLMPKHCYVCGKEFYALDPPEWVYKVNVNGHVRMCCSYKCMRDLQRKHPDRRKKNDL